MICNKCNATIEDDSVFCKKCGNMVKPKISEVCLSYANEAPKGRGIYGSDIALEAPKETSSVTGQFYGEDLHYVPPKENNETTANNYTAYNQVAHRTNANSSLHSTYSSATNNYSRSTSRISLRPLVRLFAFVLIILGAIFFISKEFGANSKPTSVSDPDSKLVPMIKPESGTILHGRIYNYDDDSAITVTASGNSSCVVKLKTAAGVTKLSFFCKSWRYCNNGRTG